MFLPEQGAVTVQITVDPPDAGRRQIAVYSRTGDEDDAWTRHASGVLAGDVPGRGACEWAGVWPPVDAVVVEVEGGGYERLGGGAGLRVRCGVPGVAGVVASW
ncbi:hypothetical protein ACFSTC_12390 [Nonomuraea ferruginea]